MNFLPDYVWTNLVFSVLIAMFIAHVLGKRKKPLGLEGRLDMLDFAKGIAIITVVLVHVGVVIAPGRALYPYFGFGVELFIICSGYLLARRYASGLEAGEYLKKMFFRVVLIYALFVIAICVATSWQDFSAKDLALAFLLGNQIGSGFYFIPVIIQLYLLFPLIRGRWKKHALATLLAVLAVSLIWNYFDSQLRKPDWNSNQLVLAFAGRYLFFFAFGIYLSAFALEKMDAGKAAGIAAFYIAGAVAITLWSGGLFLGYAYPVFALFACVLAYGLFCRFDALRLIVGPINSLGRQSLLIYLVHAMLLYGVVSKLPLAEFGWQGEYVAYAAMTLVLSYAFAVLFMEAYKKLTGFSSTS